MSDSRSACLGVCSLNCNVVSIGHFDSSAGPRHGLDHGQRHNL